MLARLHIRNFTVFEKADLEFVDGLNVMVGTNGTGKSHLLKVGYAVGDASLKIAKTPPGENSALSEALTRHVSIMDSFDGVFRTDGLWHLRRSGCSTGPFIEALYQKPAASLIFDLSPSGLSSSEVTLKEVSVAHLKATPLFIPAKEVLSFYEGFSALYRKYNLTFDQTYLDLCEALSGPTLREPGTSIQTVLSALERIMQGRVALEGGRFYLYPAHGEKQEMNLAAEGIRKFATLAQLLANGSLTTQTTLFWDEPEANLNPALLRELAYLLMQLANQGFQLVIATHSLFLLKEFHILAQQQPVKPRYFGLNAQPGQATQVVAADDLTLLPNIVALDAELTQSDEFITALHASADEV